jgi:DNA mismatch repair ATPase MutS
VRVTVLCSFSDERTEYANLFGLLNRGRTKMSGRLLETWIKQPLTSLPDIGSLAKSHMMRCSAQWDAS